MTMSDTCYMCSAKATGKEHAPPRCVFPAKKDFPPGVDYRKNLIRVPSCDAHNTAKCQDDEYLAFVLATHFANNAVAARQILTKVVRALSRRPSLTAFFQTQRPILLDGAETLAYEIDNDRFERALSQMARALYFHHFSEKWLAPLAIHSPAVFQFDNPDAAGLQRSKENLARMAFGFMSNQPRLGANPEVFWYQVYRDTSQEFLMVNMVFYEGVHMVVLSHPKLKREPNNTPEGICQPVDGLPKPSA